MIDADKTWALVVGIDRYDLPEISPLTGAVADAVAAVRWLRSLGVPDQHIYLNASPAAKARALLEGVNITIADNARFASIWASIFKLDKIDDGKRLFVFLSGHGLYQLSDGRLFLTQEYGVDSNWSANLGLEEFQKFFLSMKFAEQFLFFDGCQNYDTTPGRTSAVAANGPPIKNRIPIEANGLVACFAASQNEVAIEVKGRGAMLGPLLEELQVSHLANLSAYDPRQTAIAYDWKSGSRALDLRKLFFDFIKPQVEKKASDADRRQTPLLEVYGAAGGWPELRILDLPAVATALLKIEVDPPESIEAIEQIIVSARLPHRDYYLPPPAPLNLPDACRVPNGATVEPSCSLNPFTPWVLKETPPKFTVARPEHDAVFKLERMAVMPRPSTRGMLNLPDDWPQVLRSNEAERVNIRLLSRDGKQTSISPDAYNEIAAQANLEMPIETGNEHGIRMIRYIYGPDFVVPKRASKSSGRLVEGWARALARHRPEKIDRVAVIPPGKLFPDYKPNLEFRMPSGGARQLGGFLSEARVVFIERAGSVRSTSQWSDDGEFSLGALEDLKCIRAEPGYQRVTVDLPWGSWTNFVDVPRDGVVTCELPPRVGLPPLRNSVPRGAKGSPGSVAHVISTATNGWSEGVDFEQFRAGRVLSIPFKHLPEDSRYMTFPWPVGGRMAIDIAGNFPRVEPYSTSTTPEWDLLISCGRLEAIASERLASLCQEGSEADDDVFLGVALAYAAYSARSWKDLKAVLHRVSEHSNDILDIALLQAELKSHASTGADHAEEIGRRLTAGELPIFRWGLQLTRRISTVPTLLDQIQAVVSSWSNWTVGFGPRPALSGDAIETVGKSPEVVVDRARLIEQAQSGGNRELDAEA
jgi:hypothetical protein